MKRLQAGLFILLCLNFSGNLSAQEGSQRASRYIIPGEQSAIQMQINLWGQVRQPGIYKIPSDMDLISLLSVAGGPTDMAKLNKVQIIRAYPDSGEARVLEVDIENYLEAADVSGIPTLYPGDTVYVPGNFRRYFSEGLDIFGSIAAILSAVALIYERIVRAGSY